ncbi:hypothetical protein [Anaerostipes hominis (ex Lee et al. 2021)]
MKKLDSLLKNKIPTGFEMLYDNSSAGILVMLCFWHPLSLNRQKFYS